MSETENVARGLWPLDFGGPVERPFEPFPEQTLETSVVDRFELIARRHPTRIAVADTVDQLTYGELANLVRRIAIATVTAVGERGGPVAILLPHTVNFPAAMLGVLAAGRGYVPLDAGNPVERNQLIATQSGAAAIVSAGDLARSASGLFPAELPIVDINTIDDAVAATPLPIPRADDLAFVVYTSGSTGHPKGADHTHRNLLHDVLQQTNTLHVTPEDRIALVYSPAVIGAIREIMLSLLNGALLHILPPRELGPDGLAREIEARRITIFRTVPVLLKRVGEALGPGRLLSSVRIVGLGSQRVDWADFDLFRSLSSPEAFLIVGIGSTECGGNFAHWFVDPDLRTPNGRLPIGRVLQDARVTIENEDGSQVAAGEVGEFVLASHYIAKGYWRDPELTAQTFANDSVRPEVRTFRTGDMGRIRPDGLLEFIGRKDQMVKLRGHRIEVGEIEFALNTCRGVEDAAVLVRTDAEGMPQWLLAYVERKPGFEAPTSRELVAQLRARLPGYMVPAHFMIVDQLPRLPNLKIDREELRRRDREDLEHARSARKPSGDSPPNKIEETLLEIWRDVLRREDIGCDDDFLTCGGDSIAALDLVHRIEEQLHYQVPLTVLAEATTVAELAHRLQTATLGAIDNIIGLHTGGSRRALFVVEGAGGHLLGILPLLRSLGRDQPCYGLQPPNMDWASAGCSTLSQLASHYVGQIRTVQPQGPYRLLGASFGGLVVFEVALQLQKLGEEVECLAMIDTLPPTCVVADSISACRPAGARNPLHPDADELEKLNLRLIEIHDRMKQEYLLDSRLDEQAFRGEITYFWCTGEAAVAGGERRHLWRHFASQVRLMPLPGRHGHHAHEPQYSVLRNLLDKCLNGMSPSGVDLSSVYVPEFRLDDPERPTTLIDTTGQVSRIRPGCVQGTVDEVRVTANTIQIEGSVEAGVDQSPRQIVVFADGEFLGCSAAIGSLMSHSPYSRFSILLRSDDEIGTFERFQYFAVTGNGSAAILDWTAKPLALGSTSRLSNNEPCAVILHGDWSRREDWGMWSEGRRASVLFDASLLPQSFEVAIEAQCFPADPSCRSQHVTISDHANKHLAALSNETPAGTVIVRMEKPVTGFWAALSFEVENPISPGELGLGRDGRKLGVGLRALSFRPDASHPNSGPITA